jgi:3-oxoacyl-[acyl-carrier protein] reductase
MDLKLTNKRVLITGASKGVGAGIASVFLKEGANVFLVSRGAKQLNKTKNSFILKHGKNRIKSELCDCTDESSLELLKERVCDEWQGLDIVIVNVGSGKSVLDAIPSKDDWSKVWDTNFESALYTARVFLPLLRESKGCMLFVSSIAAMEAFGAPVNYSTAKTAMSALAKNIARKVAKDVRVNVIAPGNVYFPGGSWDEKIKEDPEKVENLIKSTVPMNRFGTIEEVANAAIFLCSEKASFITGSTLVIDGGQTVGIF